MKKTFLLFAALVYSTLFSLPTVNAQVIVKVRPVPPAVVVPRPPMRGHGMVWIEPDWYWNKRQHAYVWREGRWVKPRRHAVWVPGHWVEVREGHKWEPGYWGRRK